MTTEEPTNARWGLRVLILALFVAFSPVEALAKVRVTGMGVNKDQALNRAFQAAVEQVYGVAVASSTISEDFALLRDEVATHASGYVTGYELVEEKTDPDGVVEVVIEAEVNDELLLDHAQTTELIMRMVGKPTVFVVGDDTELGAVAAANEQFTRLVDQVEKVLSHAFSFQVADWGTLRKTHPNLRGALTPEKALKLRKQLDADYLVSVALTLEKDDPPELKLKAVRLSDGLVLGKVSRTLKRNVSRQGNMPEVQNRAVKAALEEVHFAAMDLAKNMVDSLHKETDRGHGMRYILTFLNFPDPQAMEEQLEQLGGYVRHKVDRAGSRNIRIVYWSNLQPSTMAETIEDMLMSMGHKQAMSLDGRDITFIWQNPDGF